MNRGPISDLRYVHMGPPTYVFYIILINVFVFFLWQVSDTEGLELLSGNFLVSWSGLEDGRIWTLVTSVFSHVMLFHIFINMYVLFGFGSVIEAVLGSKRFLGFYLTAGIVGSVGHAVVSRWLLGNPELPALGASGAIAGVILLFSFLYPRKKIWILGLIPVPALFGAIIFVGLDVWGLFVQVKGEGWPIGHGAHLGGAFTGMVYYYFFLR